jgi:hypothetical protein
MNRCKPDPFPNAVYWPWLSWVLCWNQKAEEEFKDSDYLKGKCIILERKWSLKQTTNGYGFDKLHLQR